MSTAQSEQCMNATAEFHQNNFRRFTIYLIKKTSNLFWEVADDWSYKSEKIARYYDKTIGGDYEREYHECGIPPDSKVLHIGCGAYPLTEMTLAQAHVRSVVGIDHTPITVQRAREVIRRRHLEKKISIEHGDGINYPVEDFDVIIASSCSLPKVLICQHLFSTAKHGSKIIIRELDIGAAGILSSIKTHQGITLEKCLHHNPFPFVKPMGWSTYCLQKK
jgi:protein-L-isoaspartate O-methyltransferase